MGLAQESLAGAGKGREVWRVGDTVRRSVGPWTPAVHTLLRHLESVGFDGAPRVLGIDDQGREILTFIPGEEGWNNPWSDEALIQAAQLIRRYHDAVRDGVAVQAGLVVEVELLDRFAGGEAGAADA